MLRLVGWFEFSGPLRQYFSLYQAVSQREGERGVKGQRRVKMSKQPPPVPYYHPNCRTPRHWKFTQDHRTTRPPPKCYGQTDNLPGGSCSVLRSFSIHRFRKRWRQGAPPNNFGGGGGATHPLHHHPIIHPHFLSMSMWNSKTSSQMYQFNNICTIYFIRRYF